MKVSIRPIFLFLVIAFGLSWIIAVPLWLGTGLSDPAFPIVSIAMMFTPAIAAVLVVRFVERPAHIFEALGLWPLKPVRRLLGYLCLGLIVPLVLVILALFVGSLWGIYPADFLELSGFKEIIAFQSRAAGSPPPEIPLGVLLALQVLAIPMVALINTIPALGEEIGWRGWLFPKLMPFGPIPAILISGIIWGLWHAPLILLGYNYPGAPGWLGLTMMVGFCTLFGAILGWLRLRSASVWPAALAHGSLNASAGFAFVFSEAGKPVDFTQATILGWSGWIAPLLLVIFLLLKSQFKPLEALSKQGENYPDATSAGNPNQKTPSS